MHSVLLAAMVMLGPRAHPGPEGIVADGPVVPSTSAALESWLRSSSALRVRSDTRWTGRRVDLVHGGWLWLLRESYRGHPVAGARLALRVGPDGRLRQVVGTSLAPGFSLTGPETGPGTGPGTGPSGVQLWWPSEAGLVPVRIEDTPLEWVDGVPRQLRHYIDADNGERLGSQSMIEEVLVPIRGWPENPLTTPVLVTYDVPLADLDPIVLQDDVFRVLDCNYSEAQSGCDSIFSPTTNDPEGFPAMPPPLDDADAHRAWDDPYASLQFMQYAARAEVELAQWGFDAFVWDVLDCSWQQRADPQDCRVWVRTNVLEEDEQGVYPYAGAFYTAFGVIHMGQGENADTSYDGDVVAHEIGHHVIASFGSPEPTEPVVDASRLITDYGALSEGSADVFAWMLGQNDRIFDYFSAIEPGPYDGPRTRDASLPFRCPDNVVGEIHMDGRMWLSAVADGLEALEDAGLAERDAYASTFLGALAAIRHIPREQRVQLPDARAILLDEIELSFGAQARAIVRDIFDARGIGRCDYVIELRDEPSITGELADAVLDARFLRLRSHLPTVAPDKVAAHPYAPPVQHRITVAAGEVGVALSYRPGLWRASRTIDEPELAAAALVKRGDQPVVFAYDDVGSVLHDAELRFESAPDGERERIVIDKLEPGQTYTIALVSLSVIGSNNDLMMEDMRWELLADGETETETETDTGGEDEGSTDAGDDPQLAPDEVGCGCSSANEDGPAQRWMFALLAMGFVFRVRQSGRTAVG